MQDFLDIAKATWQLVTFPWLFLVFIFLGFGWLWLEKQLTRLGRATPGIRGPIPLTPIISSIAIFLIIWSKRLLYFWVFLFAILLGVFYLSHTSPDLPPETTQLAFKVGHIWHEAYAFLMGILRFG